VIDARPVTGPQRAPGTAVRDSTVAVAASVVLCAALADGIGPAPVTVAGAVAGIGVVAVAGAAVMARTARWSGPADRVTLTRAVLIGGCAAIGVPILTGALPPRPWWLIVLLVPALVLDAVDGLVARRTGTSSAAGARLDMEIDAALLLVLSLIAIRSLGWWVLAIGGMRYAFALAGHLRPHLRNPLPYSRFRRVVAGLQGALLAVGLAPVVPLPLARAVVAVALTLLVVSFGRDVIWLERRRGQDRHLIEQPMLGRCGSGTGLPASTRVMAPSSSAPVTGRPLPGVESSNAPR
jgi:phosphatidylglycerophosphate synthase